jgi:hypothetical protein
MKKTKSEKEPWCIKRLLAIARTDDPELVRSFVERLRYKALVEELDPMPFYIPTLHEFMGEDSIEDYILLGKIKGSNTPFFFKLIFLLMHTLILGRTGSGKTNLLYWLISQCIMKGLAVWAFDRAKREFRSLVRLFPDTYVIDVAKARFNPLYPPPGVPPQLWNQTFTDIFCRTNSLLDGSESLLLKLISELYSDFGVFKNSGHYPSFLDLYAKCKGLNFHRYSRASNYQDSILNRLEAYLTVSPALYDCSKGYPLEELVTKNVVYELGSLSEKMSIFFLNYLLHRLFFYRIYSQNGSTGTPTICVIDECRWLFSPFINENLGWPPINNMLAMLRQFGIGIIAASQTANLNEAIFENSFLKIAMSLGSGESLNDVQKTFHLTEDEVDYMHRLQIGEAVVRYPLVEKPFAIEIPPFPMQ